ncbi:helix-hairpin-helix domain-containing protein [Pseudoalteromonas sp. SSM20]|uniref:helix-hairpin-helix domain-containing protein n=1 Tax=Pseudoalteromonas sp. SSM20 TaxID=3139394 RepID=UPI003BA966E4
MNPIKVIRENTHKLTDLPNIGKASALDLELLGIKSPEDLIGQDPFEMYERLCAITNTRHDPCVIDVFMSITDFMNGAEAKPWWDYTPQRKRILSDN